MPSMRSPISQYSGSMPASASRRQSRRGAEGFACLWVCGFTRSRMKADRRLHGARARLVLDLRPKLGAGFGKIVGGLKRQPPAHRRRLTQCFRQDHLRGSVGRVYSLSARAYSGNFERRLTCSRPSRAPGRRRSM